MSRSEHKVVQYLNEARAHELALVSTLRAHIAMTPRGEYRLGLEKHLGETREHARRLQARLRELGSSRNPLQAGFGLAQSISGQALVLAKGPLDLARGFSAEEKMLKNAKDECATEALEIATYDAIEALARALGDEETALLAADIRSDEERMLASLRAQIPKLTAAVVGAELRGQSTYDPTTTGAAEAVQQAQARAEETVGQARQAAAGTADQVRRAGTKASATAAQAKATGDVTKAQAAASGATASASELPIAGYDSLTAGVVVGRLADLTPDQLAKVDAYERANKARLSVLRVTESRLGRTP